MKLSYQGIQDKQGYAANNILKDKPFTDRKSTRLNSSHL